MKEILNVIHKTIYQFFDVCGDDEEVPISDKDKLLLEVNKAICNNLKALEQGEVSDGYHTFNQLYHQRAVLFATIVNQNKDKSWKSFKHSDGKYCFDSNGEWFIVGIDTPQGSYTYHYAKEYWDMFDCEELECGKEWDGHTEEDVIRLLSLEQPETVTEFADRCKECGAKYDKMLKEKSWIPLSERLPEDGTWNLFVDNKGRKSVERYKADAIDHFWPESRWFELEEAVAWMPLPEYKEDEE